jgi:hypothetical protein
VRGQTHLHELAGIVLLGALVCSNMGYAQESLAHPQLPSSPGPVEQRTTTNNGAPCVEPPPLVRLQDYNGPLKKTVGLFARQLERKSVRSPHYRPGLMLCSLDLEDKFLLFVRDSFDPVTFIASAFNAGLDQAENRDPSFGQGGAGYSKRFAASFADQASFKFFRDFAYPSIFSEDPRYYRLGDGSRGRRFLHALDHAFVAHRDTGARMFNFSEWLGTTSFVTLSNVYHSGNERGVAPAARLVGYNIGEDMGFDILREFWPEIARKFRLSFRTEPTLGIEANPVAR